MVGDAGVACEGPEGGSTKREYKAGLIISKFSSDTFHLAPPLRLEVLAVERWVWG